MADFDCFGLKNTRTTVLKDEVLVFDAILKNTMKMDSLRSLASIAIFTLGLSILSPAAFAVAKEEQGENIAAQELDGATEQSADSAHLEKKAEKAARKKGKGKDKKNEDTKDKEEAEKNEAPQLSAQEAAALAAAQERAAFLKTTSTPFNTKVQDAESSSSPVNASNTSSLRSRLSQRLVSSARVYMPGKIVIGKTGEFVVKAKPGSQVAIAMADKDSGAKPLFGRNLRLGPDRKLVAAGTIPENGVLTLIVDMPIQGDLIGLPVFFETAVWQKPDFSDMELATPVKSETAQELADKPNAVIVAEEKSQKRGLRFVPDSAVPLHQRGNLGLDSGRP